MNSKKTRIGNGSQYFEEKLKDVYNTMTFSDLKITCKRGHLLAHRSVLSSASPFLKELLEDPNVTVLIMPEFEISVLRNVLEIIYTGELNLDINTNELLIIEALKTFGIDESKFKYQQVESLQSNRPKLGRPRIHRSNYGRKIVQPQPPVSSISITNKPKENPKIISLQEQGNKKQHKQYSSRPRTSSNDKMIDSKSKNDNDTQQTHSETQQEKSTTFVHDYLEIEYSNTTVKTEIELTSYQNDDPEYSQENYYENNDKIKIDSIRSIPPTEYQNTFKGQGKRQFVVEEEEENDDDEETEQEKIESARIASQKDHAYAVSVRRPKGPKFRKLQKAKQVQGPFTEHSYSGSQFD